MWLYSPVCVGQGRIPERLFSHDMAQLESCTITHVLSESAFSERLFILHFVTSYVDIFCEVMGDIRQS